MAPISPRQDDPLNIADASGANGVASAGEVVRVAVHITSPAADQLYIDIPSGLNERLDAVRAKPNEHRGTTGLHPA